MPDKNRIEEYYNKFQVLPQEAKTELWELYNIYKEAKETDSCMGWGTDEVLCEEATERLIQAENTLSETLIEYLGPISWIDEDKIIKRIFEETGI